QGFYNLGGAGLWESGRKECFGGGCAPMNLYLTLACVGAAFSVTLGLAVPLRKRLSAASWSFTGGMALLAVETLFNGFSFNELAAKNAGFLQGAAFVTRSFL